MQFCDKTTFFFIYNEIQNKNSNLGFDFEEFC